MGRKRWTLEEVPALLQKSNGHYTQRHRGVLNGDFALAFFGGCVNSEFLGHSPALQLLPLYVAYLILRVTVRLLKRTGLDLSNIDTFTFTLPPVSMPLLRSIWTKVGECLHYSNVFLDYRRLARAARASASLARTCTDETTVPPFTLLHAMVLPTTRLHDVRKDADPRTSDPLDWKYCHFRTLHDRAATATLQAQLLSVWVITRSVILMDACAQGKPVSQWPSEWLSEIAPMSRDLGLVRETPESSLRAVSAILQIKRMRRHELPRILSAMDTVDDFGSFKRQHLLWNLHLLGYVRLRKLTWPEMRPFVSEQGTTACLHRFKHPETNADVPPPSKRCKSARQSPHQFADLFSEDTAVASDLTVLQDLDARIRSMRQHLHDVCAEVRVRFVGGGCYSQTVSLSHTVPDDDIDAAFAMLSNLCQLERLIKVWLPSLRARTV